MGCSICCPGLVAIARLLASVSVTAEATVLTQTLHMPPMRVGLAGFVWAADYYFYFRIPTGPL